MRLNLLEWGRNSPERHPLIEIGRVTKKEITLPAEFQQRLAMSAHFMRPEYTPDALMAPVYGIRIVVAGRERTISGVGSKYEEWYNRLEVNDRAEIQYQERRWPVKLFLDPRVVDVRKILE